ncbi:hypothetical protein GCM10009559_58500 [Pseudonocardia zijingensis]|uniref:Uncharacterized protein n=1 Tax=Pseudonocardia zijingensis TaxID=153376 RepID=A0ABP3YQA3_9PSEU
MTGRTTRTRRRRFPRAGDPSYDAALRRVRAARGPARAHTCGCGAAAVAWGYPGGDARELTDRATGRRYSADVQRYEPICAADHRRAAWASRRRDRAPLDPAEVTRLYADGCSAAGIGRTHGYTASEVLQVLRAAGVQIRRGRTRQAPTGTSDVEERTTQ